jgi:hypothetical protein
MYSSHRDIPADPGTRISALTWIRFALASACGAALIHIVEFHLAVGFRGSLNQRAAAIEYALERCPLRGPLGVLAMAAALVIAVTMASMRSQLRTLRRLDGEMASASKRYKPATTELRPLSIRSLAITWIVLGAVQLAMFAVAQHLVPMEYVMQMASGHMVMAIAPPVPPVPLSFLIALFGACVLARFERRLQAIAGAIADRILALFARARSSKKPLFSPERPALTSSLGPALFSRPPPMRLLAVA